jgi:hypothetical protein
MKSEVVLKNKITWISSAILIVLMVFSSQTYGEELEVEVSKDSFFRRGNNNRNNGANPQLLMVEMPISRTVISFDLSSVTNEIESAAFHFVQNNSVGDRNPLSFTVVPMVQTTLNAAWGEGQGNLAIKGHLAKEGEATPLYSSYPSAQWETAGGKSTFSLFEEKVWERPVFTMDDVVWTQGGLIKIPLEASMLEKIRNSDIQILTLGMWGTSGKGFYYIRSKESGDGPKLVLQLKEEPPEE